MDSVLTAIEKEESALVNQIEALYVMHAPVALKLAYIHAGSKEAAEDLVQEAFVRVMGRFRVEGGPREFERYLLRTVSNLAKKRRMRLAREVLRPRLLDGGARTTSPEFLLDAIRKLPTRQRTAIFLKYHLNFSLHDISEVLGTSVPAVKSLLHRGLAELKTSIER